MTLLNLGFSMRSLIGKVDVASPALVHIMDDASQVVRILLVEDCASDVELLEGLLEHMHLHCFYELVSVARLIDAFNKVEHESFDLVLLDLNLTDMSGVTMVEALHSQAPRLPIAVYSGLDDPKLRREAMALGAVEFFVKGRESGSGLKELIEHTAVDAA